MKKAIPSLVASWPPTTVSEGRAGGDIATATVSNAAPEILVFDVGEGEPQGERVPSRHRSVSDIVERWNRDADRRQSLVQGRRWVAKSFLADEGDTVRTLRLRRGWSQSQLASELGTSQSHVARIERGTENLSLDTCRRLCSALGVDMNALDLALRRQESLREGGESR